MSTGEQLQAFGRALRDAGYMIVADPSAPRHSPRPLSEALAAVRPLIEAEVRREVADEIHTYADREFAGSEDHAFAEFIARTIAMAVRRGES